MKMIKKKRKEKYLVDENTRRTAFVANVISISRFVVDEIEDCGSFGLMRMPLFLLLTDWIATGRKSSNNGCRVRLRTVGYFADLTTR